jgi:hypothetical protein
MKLDHDPTIHQHAQAGSQAERRKQHLRNPIQARHFIKKSIYSEYKPLDWF